MSLSKKYFIVALFTFAMLPIGLAFASQQQTESEAADEVPFLYPDPRTVGVKPYIMHAKPAGAVTPNRYAGISEQERQARIHQDLCEEEIEGFAVPNHEHLPCPLCENLTTTPCGTCKMCIAGFPCEKTLCRHDVQPRSKNMGNSCDLTAGDEPCGTCDACREHRSDPCEHADDGYGLRGEFNPYKEPRHLSVIPRPILDTYNNGARKFPVYYNPAPYYRPTWNPSLFTGYARPYTFRWSCPLCFKDPCECASPGLAGQVPYAYTCKFCNRNPCACAQDICNVTKLLDPKGVSAALEQLHTEYENAAQPVPLQDASTQSSSTDTSSGEGVSVDALLDESTPVVPEQEPSDGVPNPPANPRPALDSPTQGTSPAAGSTTVS